MEQEASGAHSFLTGKVWRVIVAQAVPLTFAQLVQLLYNIVDRIYIGHIPDTGSLALTGVGLTFPFVTFILAFSYLFGTGGTPLFSIARGRREEEQAKEIMGNVFTLIVLSSVVIFAVCYLFRTPVLYLFGASDATIPYAQAYLEIYLLGVPFSMVTTGMNGFINAQGFPRVGMGTTVIGAVLNLILDPIFIFGLHLGVRGAAIATVVGQCVSALWVLRFLLGKRAELTLEWRCLRLRWSVVRRVLALGVTGFIQQATNCLVQILCNAKLQQYGGDVYVEIMTILNSVREVAQLPVTGLTNGGQPVLGYNYGAQQNERVKAGIRFLTAAGVIYTAVFWLVILLVPSVFIRIFSSNPETIALGASAMRIYFMGFVFMSLQFAGQTCFVGLGRAKQAVFFSVLRKVIIVAPLTILLPSLMGLGVNGVFLAEPISNLIGGLACFFTMWITLYRKL